MVRLGWFDLLCLLATGAPALIVVLGDRGPLTALPPGEAASLMRAVLPASAFGPGGPWLAIGLLAGPLFIRLPWRIGLGLAGVGLLALVAAAWRLERAGAPTFDVMPPAITLVLVYGLAMLLRTRRRTRGAAGRVCEDERSPRAAR